MNRKKGNPLNGSLRAAGVTIYSKQGKFIMRPSRNHHSRRCTAQQFDVRERMAHNTILWKTVRPLELIDRPRFFSLAAKLPALYLTREEHYRGYTLLLPGTPVACGTLPDIGCRLGTVGGQPALLTDLSPALLARGERLALVTLEQVAYGGKPQLAAARADVPLADFTLVDGTLALVDGRFADERLGWALVRCRGGLCSTQTVVTAATRYRLYLGPDALQRAAASYGGLTP